MFIILLVLCPYISYGVLQAQLYRTSSAQMRSYSTGGSGVTTPNSIEFRSTSRSVASASTNAPRCFSTAPMQVANGSIKTVASSIQGGMLAENRNNPSNPAHIQGRRNSTMEPPINTDAPLGDGWDVALLLSFLCLGYAVYLKRKTIKDKVNG